MSTTPPHPGRPSRRATTRASALGAALAALVLVAGACSTSHRPAGASTTSTIPPTTTTTEPPPQYAPSPYAWDRAASPTLAIGGGASATLSAVLAPELTGGWQVFGTRLGATGTPSPTMWSSPDALAWTAAPLGSGPGQATAAARYRATTVAVGSTGEGAAQQAAVWLSSEGDAPFTSESVPSDSNGPSVMMHVTVGALGMFASGTIDGRFAMWSSTNGRRWSELPAAEKVIGNSPGARVEALLAEGDFVYAAGSLQSGGVPQAALWATGDGINWRLVGSAATSFSGPGGRVIYSLAPLGTGLVAVGALDEGSGWIPASWISPDGQSWSLPSVDFPAVPRPVAVGAAGLGPSGGSAARSVSAVPTLAGATSVVAAGGGPYGQVAWRSSDGLHWSSMSLPATDAASTSWRAELSGATVDTAVVLDAEPGQPYVLTRRTGPPGGGAQTTTSAPPSTVPTGGWTQPSADPSVFGPVRPQAVPVALRTEGGHLQLTVDVVNRPQTIGVATVSTTVLSSSDGSTWTAAPAAPGAGGPPTLPVPGAVTARLPGLWVAVSPGGQQVWTSPSGTGWKRVAVLSLPGATAGAPVTTTTRAAGLGVGAPVPTISVNGVCTARLNGAGPGTTVTTTSAAEAPPRYVVAAVGAAATTSSAVAGGTAGAAPGALNSGLVTTRSATAWSSTSGASWKSAPVGGGPPPGATSSMSGCLATGAGLVAYGTATNGNGAPVPSLWHSADGVSWARVPVAAFGPGTPTPVVSLALDGEDWLAAANPDPSADPFSAGTAGGPGSPGPAATAGLDAGVGPSPSIEDGRDGLWLSPDGGSTWQIIDTATAPWLGSQQAVIDLVAFATGARVHATSSTTSVPSGGSTASSGATPTTGVGRAGGGSGGGSGGGGSGGGGTGGGGPGGEAGTAGSVPVVVGVVDGQLAVWTGTTTAAGA